MIDPKIHPEEDESEAEEEKEEEEEDKEDLVDPHETVIVVPDHASSTPATASHNGHNSGERKTMTNLIERPPALLQYMDLVYTVREKSGKFGSSWFATKTILKGIFLSLGD